MARKALIAALMLVVSLAGGCGHSENEGSSGEPAVQTRVQEPDQATIEMERLRALPYAGYADVEPGEEEDGVVVNDPRRSCPGYNLYTMHERCAAELIDMSGSIIRRWEHPAGQSWGNGELLPDGDFVVVGADPSGLPEDAIADETRYVMRFNWAGELLWKRRLTAHHDIELTPRGQLLTPTFARRIVPEVDPVIPVRDDRLTLLSPAGDVLETLSFYDVLSARPEVFPLARVGPNDTGGERWIDLFHCNSVEWMHYEQLQDRHPIYGPGNVLVCFRHQNRIAIVDWDAQRVLWAWGAGELSGPHDAHVLASGNLLVFDNGMERNWSRVIELDPLRKKIVWQYRAPNPGDFFTISKGASQRLPNGNTLITNSDHGQAFEVTPAGEIVWDFRCPHHNAAGQRATIVRLMRYERAYVERIQALCEHAATQPTP